jgi:hypothetical protein
MGRLSAAIEAQEWAEDEFGQADLGHWSRTSRLVRLAAAVARNPGGKISEVCRTDAERQAAYDFLEDGRISPASIAKAAITACAARASKELFVFVPVDGSSLNLADGTKSKRFGSIGSRERGANGLKVISCLAISPSGTPLGLLGQTWWARGARSKKKAAARKVQDKETRFWLETIDQAAGAVAELDCKPLLWFQIDREGDNRHILQALKATGQWFTVRSSHNRRIKDQEGVRRYLSQRLLSSELQGEFLLDIPSNPNRSVRTACMEVRASSGVVLSLPDKSTKKRRELEVNVVWAIEKANTRPDEKPLIWCLLTNFPVATFQQARQVIRGYATRWRIEDFHRTWKSGGCNIEQSQLRDRDRMIKWATILAGNAVRIERLKHLSRQEPNLPASVELTPHEIQAVILLKRNYKKRTEEIPDTMPTISQATTWIAELGGYTGKSSGGPPGSTTIGRGFEMVRTAALVLELVGSDRKTKRRTKPGRNAS